MTKNEDNRVHFLLDHLNVTGHVTLNEEDMLLILRHQRELGKEDALAEMHDLGKLYSEIRTDERTKTIDEILHNMPCGHNCEECEFAEVAEMPESYDYYVKWCNFEKHLKQMKEQR